MHVHFFSGNIYARLINALHLIQNDMQINDCA